MAEIKKTIKLEYISTGLEKITKELEKVTKSGLEIDTTKINDAIKNLKASLSKGAETPAGMIEFAKAYKEVVSAFKEKGVEIYTLFDEDARISLVDFKKQLDEVYASIAKIDRASEKISKTIEEVKKGDLSSVTNIERKKAQNELGENEELISPTGRAMSDSSNFIKLYDEAIEKISQIDGIRAEIIEKLKAGDNLSDEELQNLTETLEKQKAIKITAEEFITQSKTRAQILKDEPEQIIENLKLREAELQVEKDKLEIKKDAIKLNEQEVAEGTFLGEDESLIQVITDLSNAIEKLTNDLLKENQKAMDGFVKDQEKTIKAVDKTTKSVKKQETTFGKAAKQVFAYGTAFAFLKRIYKETIKTVKELDKAMTDMAIVTQMSRQEA